MSWPLQLQHAIGHFVRYIRRCGAEDAEINVRSPKNSQLSKIPLVMSGVRKNIVLPTYNKSGEQKMADSSIWMSSCFPSLPLLCKFHTYYDGSEEKQVIFALGG